MKSARTILHQMAVDAWASSAVVLVLCLALEAVERGFVSRFFNLLWLLLVVLAATLLVMLTHPGVRADDDAHRPAKKAEALLGLAAVACAAAVWFLLPRETALHWRAAAAGIVFALALSAKAAFAKNE